MNDTTKAAADKKLADDKKRLSEERERRQKEGEEHAKRMRGTPTPTQEENDLVKLGNFVELAKDGSEEEPSGGFTQRQLEGGRHEGGGYETREHQARHAPEQRPAAARHSSSSTSSSS
jgi:hypothetical protein